MEIPDGDVAALVFTRRGNEITLRLAHGPDISARLLDIADQMVAILLANLALKGIEIMKIPYQEEEDACGQH